MTDSYLQSQNITNPTHELFRAIHACNPDGVRKSMEDGANPNSTCQSDESPLMACVKKGQVASIRILLNEGADINQVNSKGDTFLHLVARELYARENLIPMALKAGVDPNHQNELGETPLVVAVKRYNIGVIDKLHHHTDITLTDVEGNSIWHHAIRTEDLNFIEKIFTMSYLTVPQNRMTREEFLVFLTQPNKKGFTPLQIAQAMENSEIHLVVEELIGYVEKQDTRQLRTLRMTYESRF